MNTFEQMHTDICSAIVRLLENTLNLPEKKQELGEVELEILVSDLDHLKGQADVLRKALKALQPEKENA